MAAPTSAPSMLEFSNTLVGCRIKQGKTPAGLARRFRVSEEEYKAIEAGTLIPDSRTFNHICAYFGQMNKFKPLIILQRQLQIVTESTSAAKKNAEATQKATSNEEENVAAEPMTRWQTFGQALADIRAQLNFTPDEFGGHYGITPMLVRRIENGNSAIPEDLYMRLLKDFPELKNQPRPGSISTGQVGSPPVNETRPPPKALPAPTVPRLIPEDVFVGPRHGDVLKPVPLQGMGQETYELPQAVSPPPPTKIPVVPPVQPPVHYPHLVKPEEPKPPEPAPPAPVVEAPPEKTKIVKWSKAIVAYTIASREMPENVRKSVVDLLRSAEATGVPYSDVIAILDDE